MKKTLEEYGFKKAKQQPPEHYPSALITTYKKGVYRVSINEARNVFVIHLSEFPVYGMMCWLSNDEDILSQIIPTL